MGASSRAASGAPAHSLPGPSNGVRDHRIPQKSSGEGLFSPRGSFFADSQGNTELGFRDRAGEGHCSIPNTPSTPEGPLPLLEKGEATLGFRFGSIISSFSRLSRGVFLYLHGQVRSTNYCFLCVQKACPNLLSSLGRMWASCHCCFTVLRESLMLLSHGFVAK